MFIFNFLFIIFFILNNFLNKNKYYKKKCNFYKEISHTKINKFTKIKYSKNINYYNIENIYKIKNNYFCLFKFIFNKKKILNIKINKKIILIINKILNNNYKKSKYINNNIFMLYKLKKINNKNKFTIDKLILIKIITIKEIFYLINYLNYNFYIIKTLNREIINFPINDKYKISSKFNLFRLNPITNKISPHNGIDIATPIGTKIYSISKGIIKKVSYDKNSGIYIIIKHKNYITKYLHLSKVFVKKNDLINKNHCIALSGNSGRTTGPHLHFEIWKNNKPIDPLNYYLIINDKALCILNKYIKLMF